MKFFQQFNLTLIGRKKIGENINEVLKQKFYSSAARKYKISFKEFKKIRSDQLFQMYNVYNEILAHNCRRFMRPNDITDVSIEAARRSTGEHQFFNDGFLALDENDIYLTSICAQLNSTLKK